MNPSTPLILTVAAVLATASAQSTGSPSTGAGARTMTPDMRARMAQFQPIMDLAQTVALLPELEKVKGQAVSKAQAKQLLPILQTLQKASSIKGADATKYLTQIEDKILTDKQLTAIDSLQLKREQERRARMTQGQTGQNRFGPGGAQGQGRPQGQNGSAQGGARGGPFGANGGAFNPFKNGRTADALKAYITVLQKK
ncbi:hypothetical protein [Deinococcus maricopensis]|uniref:Uncharacterized protein n=1 Tax=Deinococcus maricopensis (strain DSM 21211 / LMG 22137 / NRRL B-23946 / LB-34) TaxID=709986 RepID=E8U668_DEIML|nr:hypothetical protein [Deinococcus maricopensis]ADV66557.1 hypothetical protein Deima_0903 [Deinococcus maricopensis DSM 21211]